MGVGRALRSRMEPVEGVTVAARVLYWRDKGPICFEADLFFPEVKCRERALQLASSELRWWWTSAFRDGSESRDSILAGERRIQLGADTVDRFVSDFAGRDPDGFGRFVTVVGHAPASDAAAGPRALPEEIGAFLRGAPSSPEAVILQLGDSRDFVFVPSLPSKAVSQLLAGWGLGIESAGDKRPYARLGVARLESVFRDQDASA